MVRVVATLPFIPRQVAAIVQVMRHCNVRAQDVIRLRGCDLHRDGDISTFRPGSDKNLWREEESRLHDRLVHLAPNAQTAIRPFLKDDPQEYLCSLRDAVRVPGAASNPTADAAHAE